MEHIEEAGVHSGDSACAIPPQTLSAAMVARIETQTRALADALDVRGLLNVQYTVKGDELYVIEAEPARQPHRPVREQGDRRAAGQGRVPGDGGRHAGASSATRACSARPPPVATSR